MSLAFPQQILKPDNNGFYVIAGPCSIESKEQFLETASFVKEFGASILRGGIFKMRTSPGTFQGVGKDGFEWIRDVKTSLKMPLISEVTDPRQIHELQEVVDAFQVGSRNMYNYELLKELGQQELPVMLKRGFSALLDEWIKASEYLVQGGNKAVLFCERGIRTFETKMRNTLDLASVAYLKQNTQLPIIVDPSHGTGNPQLITPMACAAIAAGADGIMVEVHPRPEKALSDGFQALNFEAFKELMAKIKPFVEASGKTLITNV